MNNISEKDILNSAEKINKLYDKLTYLDIYGNSVVLFIVITLVVFLTHSYCMVMLNAEAIKDDWIVQRCNPRVIPFAGFINKPENKSIVDFTGENFNYCIQSILVNITGFAVQPFNFLISGLTSVFAIIQEAIDNIRKFIVVLRTNVQNIAEETLNRILNILIPIQQIFIGIRDAMSKIEGILTAGLYTTLGAYYGLKSLMGAIVEMIIIVLIVLAAIIIGLWLFPITWSMAITLTAVFIGISIPMAILVLFMTEVLHIQTEGVPGIPSCFDKNTMIKMNDGTYKPIIEIAVGDILENENTVTAKIKVNAIGLNMYNLNGVIVSDSHIVKYNNVWIPVKLHPNKTKIVEYHEQYLYCLNTTTKEILINDMVFTDWDEIYEDKIDKILETRIFNNNEFQMIGKRENIHLLYKGFPEETKIIVNNLEEKLIRNVQIGDKVKEHIIYGIVELGTLENIGNSRLLNNNNKYSKDTKIYHLLTNSKKIIIGEEEFEDYNSFIDLNIQK